MNKTIFTVVLPCVVTSGILAYFCIKDNNLLTLISIIPKLNMRYLLCALLMPVVYWTMDCLILKEISPDLLSSFGEYFKLVMHGQFYGAITPFSSGSQPAQVAFLTKKKVDMGKSVSALSQKMFITQLCTVIVSSLSIIFKSHLFEKYIPAFKLLTTIGLMIQCSGIVAIILFYLNKHKLMYFIVLILTIGKKLKLLKNTKQVEKRIDNRLSHLIEKNFSIDFKISTYLLAFMQIFSTYLISFFIAKSFGLAGFSVFDTIAAQVFITLLSTCTPLPGAAGTTEGTFIILYSSFFRPEDISISMILFRIISYYFGLLIGLISIIKIKK